MKFSKDGRNSDRKYAMFPDVNLNGSLELLLFL